MRVFQGRNIDAIGTMKRTFITHINQHGFTMIEMVMVLVIMAIVGTFIAYRPATESNELLAQTEILKSHLRYAQIKAMNETTVLWGIRIPDANSYILYRNNAVAKDNSGNDIMLPGENPGVSPAPQTHTLPTGITITTGFGPTFNFNEWGIPVNTGSPPVPIATGQTITLSQGSATSSITITKNTGYIP
jgi:prepilin-type N-terminal cleavage/methylation domain-containing protein